MYGFLVMLGVVTLIFFLFNIKPGDPARMLGGQNANDEIIRAIKKDLGLDLPLYKQYLLYLNDLSPISIHEEKNSDSHLYLDTAKYNYAKMFSIGSRAVVFKWPYFRRSYRTTQNVSEIIWDSLPGTVVLAFTSILLASILGIIMGVVAAVNKDKFFDHFCTTVAILGISGPSYFVGLIFAWIGGYLWYTTTYIPWLPVMAMGVGLLFGLAFNNFGKINTGGLRARRGFMSFLFLGNNNYQRVNIFRKFSYTFLFESALKGFGLGFLLWFVGLGVNGLFGQEMLPLISSYMELPGTGLETSGSMYMPVINDDGSVTEELALANLVLPTLALGIRPLAIVLQLTRSSLLDVMSQDYVRTARAKGLSFLSVLFKHALKNALNPVITALSGWFASLLAGAVFIEEVFSWNGIGKKVYDAVNYNDLPVVIGSVLVIASMFVVLNIIVDIIYGILDPRVRVKA
jgi:ABC-type dipeptide/oligopeptide/nickel transport system permease component